MVNLTIDGRELAGVGIDFLAQRLAGLVLAPRAEVWLHSAGGPAICLLKSDQRAMLMLLRSKGDPGLTSRALDTVGCGVLPFLLANGQADEYPAAWTIPFDEARRALEFFWFQKNAAPFISWHDDAG
jgi:hypothetical protein